jgi:hypothetical protein
MDGPVAFGRVLLGATDVPPLVAAHLFEGVNIKGLKEIGSLALRHLGEDPLDRLTHEATIST